MRPGLTGRTLLASAVLAAVLGVAFGGLFLSIRRLEDSAEESRRAHVVVAAASEYARLVIDVQTGARGFVITGNPIFLEPANEARRRIPTIEAELELLVRDPAQRGRLASIEAEVESYLEDYADALVDQAREDPEAASRTVVGGEGKRRVDAIRRLFTAFTTREEALAEARADRVDRSANRAVLVAAGGLGVSLALVLLFALYMSRAVAAPVRRLAAAAGRLAAGDLGARVAVRGRDEVARLGGAFNTMAASIEQSRDELEAQNSELEAQQVELEAQQAELETQQVELEETMAQVGEKAGLLQAVLDTTRDGIRLVDLEGEPLFNNARFEEMVESLGVQLEGSREERVRAAAALTTDPDAFLEFMRAAVDPEFEGEHEYGHAQTGQGFRLYTAPVRDSSGSLIGRLSVLRDVTAEREVERLKSDLVATVSHELRTPLASIVGFSELMTTRELDEATRKRYTRTIHEESRRLTALINDFLDVQRIEEGRFTLDLEPFELGEVLRQQVELFSGQSEAHRLRLDLPDEPLEVVGESDRIAQVVANLVSNAIKYSPGGGEVVVAATHSDGAVRVSVTDKGVGIPPDQQDRIFTKFFRVDSSDSYDIGGTGLGLALAREIVDAHGGRIGFESVEGRGSTFWFELPSGATPSIDTQAYVLVVEDDAAAAGLLEEWLTHDGYAVEVAASGEEALARIDARTPDVVCLDIRLAGELDGWETLARMKAGRNTAGIPVVVCTGGNGRDRAAALGAANFLPKPISPESLRAAIARVLPGGRGQVLVVDDDARVRRLVVETLGALGLDLAEAADGAEALAAIAERRPDAVVLDLIMPGVDGFAVLESLQADPTTRTVPVIVLTAKRLSGEERERLRRRAVSLLEKSVYSAAELRRLVALALGR